MKVKDLRAAVSKMPHDFDDYNVVLEGCDCYGEWNGKIEPVTVAAPKKTSKLVTKSILERSYVLLGRWL